MIHWFCPRCWEEIPERTAACPRCGANLVEADREPYTTKLTRALAHPDAETVLRVIDLLGARGAEEAVPALARIARGGPFAHAAEHAVRALARIGTPAAWSAVAAATRHPTFFVRAAAAVALAEAPADLAQPALGPLLDDPSPTVREAAAAALARLVSGGP